MRWLRVRWRLLRRTLHELRGDAELKKLASAASVQRIFWAAPVLAAGNFLAALGFSLRQVAAGGQELLWRNLIITANLAVERYLRVDLVFGLENQAARHQCQDPDHLRLCSGRLCPRRGLVITLIDQLVMTSITPFLLCVTIVGTFYYLYPHYSLVLFGAAYLVFRRALAVVGSASPNIVHSNQVNGLIVTALGFALSLLSWLHFGRTTMQERTIKGQQAKLRDLAYRDPLTGLPNRRFLDERIRAEVSVVKGRGTEASLDHVRY